MALKAIMLRNRIDKKMSELEELRKKDEEFLNREAELEVAINEAVTEEEQQVVSEQVDVFDAEKTEHEEARPGYRERLTIWKRNFRNRKRTAC